MTEALSRLTAKTHSWDAAGHGGIPEYQGMELAAALAGHPPLARGPLLLGLAAYVGDETVLAELEQIVLVEASKLFRPDDVVRPGFLRELCAAAIADVCKPPRCPACHGTRDLPVAPGAPQTCPQCLGLGLVHMGAKRAQERLRIGYRRWLSLRQPYQRLEGLLWDWDGQVRGRVKMRMSRRTVID